MRHSMIRHYHQIVKNTSLSLLIYTFMIFVQRWHELDTISIDKNHIQKHPWNLNE